MAAQKGSSFLLKENSSGTPVVIGGLRSSSMTVTGEMDEPALPSPNTTP